jgi:hypothetical protein
MRSRTALGAMGALAAGPITVLTMSAFMAAPAHASTFGAHWALNETGSPPKVAVDDLNGNNGAPSGVVGNGNAYTFKGAGRVVVPDSPTLSPGTANFRFGVTVNTTLPAPGTDYDLLRKGLSSTAGGEFKIEILNLNGSARAMCLVKDAQGHVASVRAPVKVGTNQTIACAKTASGVSVRVAGGTTFTKNVAGGLGSVGNNGQLLLGAKSSIGGDSFKGTMGDAYVR